MSANEDGGKAATSWNAMTGNERPLTLERFVSLVDAYGGDLARWPAGFAGAAEDLLGTSPEARHHLAEARALDRLLAKPVVADPAALAALAERIVAAASGGAVGAKAERRQPAQVIGQFGGEFSEW